jgi:hypothetical protein
LLKVFFTLAFLVSLPPAKANGTVDGFSGKPTYADFLHCIKENQVCHCAVNAPRAYVGVEVIMDKGGWEVTTEW